jgi:DNA-binding LacI/PurR family transcriptional regulator
VANHSEDRRGATIFEVAQAAGVSITTVSHVFSGKRPVKDETRRRVEEAADRLAYRPRASARALASGRTMTLAIQFPYQSPDVLFNPYFSEMVPAMSEAALVRGYAFVFVPPGPSEGYLRTLVEHRGVDGAILLDPIEGDRFPVELTDAGIPFVSLGRIPGRPESPHVDHDYAALMAEVAAHLARAGYERPALMNLPGRLTTLIDIEEGFRSAFPSPLVTSSADHTDRGAAEAATDLLGRADAPDAVVCVSERQAAAIYRVADDLGLEIPDDLGVVTLGGTIAQGMVPAVTSVELSADRTGRELIVLLDRLLDGEPVPPLTVVPFALQPRSSTRRPG